MSRLLKVYNDVLHRYTLTTSCISTGILMGAGDVISQMVVERLDDPSRKFQFKRTFQFFCIGAFYVGPVVTIWYRVLDKIVKPGGKIPQLYGVKKMAIDQAFMAPSLISGLVFIVGTLQGKSFPEVKKSYKEKFPDIMMANYKLWPIAQVINFTFVPLHYQILYVQFISLFWNTYLCFKTRPDKTE